MKVKVGKGLYRAVATLGSVMLRRNARGTYCQICGRTCAVTDRQSATNPNNIARVYLTRAQGSLPNYF